MKKENIYWSKVTRQDFSYLERSRISMVTKDIKYKIGFQEKPLTFPNLNHQNF